MLLKKVILQVKPKKSVRGELQLVKKLASILGSVPWQVGRGGSSSVRREPKRWIFGVING